MWFAIIVLLLALPVFLLVRQLVLYIRYQYKAWGMGCGAPHFAEYQWLGIPALLRGLKMAKRDRLLTHLYTQHTTRPNGAHTVALNGISGLNIFSMNPENIKAVLSTQFKDFNLGNRQAQLEPLLGSSGIFTLDGDGWYHSRAMLRPQFTRERVVDQINTIEPHVAKLIDLFKQRSAEEEGCFDVQGYFQSYTTELTLQFLFDEHVDCLSGDPVNAQFQTAFDSSQQFLMLRSQTGVLYPLIDSKKFRQDCRVCHEYIDNLVDRSLLRNEKKGTSDGYVFIDELIKQSQDRKLLRDQCISVMLAGRDTTASLLSFSCYLLARNKHILAKLKQAILEEFGTEKEALTYDALRQCEYLKNFLNEVLRFYSTVSVNFREAVRDTTLPKGDKHTDGAIFVPKGTQIFISSWVMHRYKEYWGEDADLFEPDRWTRDNCPTDPWAFIAFNGGPRVCIGQQLALSEASYTLARGFCLLSP